jgi:hypothetical protein
MKLIPANKKQIQYTDHADKTDEHGKIFNHIREIRPFRVFRVPHYLSACASL